MVLIRIQGVTVKESKDRRDCLVNSAMILIIFQRVHQSLLPYDLSIHEDEYRYFESRDDMMNFLYRGIRPLPDSPRLARHPGENAEIA